ncbi:acyl-CoA dehydrogenase [Ramaria rubella]|nr:acyl-CoA dehydrogenase [Ramaria rubella]
MYHHALLNLHSRYWETHIFPHAEEWEKAGEIPVEVYKDHARRGLILPDLPRKYRGIRNLPANIPDAGILMMILSDWDLFHSVVLMEEGNRCPHPGVFWSLGAGNGIGCPPILKFGTEVQRQKYLPQVYAGDIRFCLGITEPDAGSDVAAIRTTATKSQDQSHYVVNGAKKWITNGLWADYVTAAVRTGGPGMGGISLLIIPLQSTPGVVTRRMYNSGLNASGSAFITFADVKVPVENLIGGENEGFKIIMSNFNAERLAMAIGSLRLAQTCFEEAWGHALRRHTFGKLLMENQIMRAKFAAMTRVIESCHAWMEQIVFQMHNQKDSARDPQVGAKLALLKVQAGKTLEMCCREAQQVFGGLGVSKAGRGRVVEQISRDLRVFVVGGGSEEILDELGIRLMLTSKSKM